MPFQKIQLVVAHVAAHLDEDVSLDALASRAKLSAYHLHRAFAAAVGETPKQLTLRLRLGRAAVLLLMGGDSVLNVALACGFQSHEVFCRTFRRRFGMTPSAYRKRGFVSNVDAAARRRHAAIVSQVAPCVGLFHISDRERSQNNDMAYSITTKELAPQPVLVIRRRVKRSDIAATIGAVLPRIFVYAQRNAIALAGQPFTRYIESSPGMVTIEPGMQIAGARPHGTDDPEIVAAELPGGLVAMTTHTGPYETLSDAHAAIQQWIEAEGRVAAGAPWEYYVTDPADCPDPKDWKTDVFWPLAR